MRRPELTKRISFIASIACGVAYGVVAQLAARAGLLRDLYAVMSFGYVFILPLVLGSVAVMTHHERVGVWRAIGLSLTAALLCLLVALAVGWEGSICLLMALPVHLPLAALGGVFGRWFADIPSRRGGSYTLLLLAAPFVSALAEAPLPLPEALHVVSSAQDIHASAAAVWREIIRVRPIHERQDSWFFWLGFPRPVEATLSHEGIGGVRHARFERGLMFIETVSIWEPNRRLGFEIQVDPAHTPLTTLDAHVTVGGRYFDVLRGEYSIEPRPDGVRLHLASTHRVSTRFNFYSARWSRLLMQDIQTNILRVIAERAEHAGPLR